MHRLVSNEPRHSFRCKALKEGVGVELLWSHYPCTLPDPLIDQSRRNHRRNTGLICGALDAEFPIRGLVVGDIVDVVGLRLSLPESPGECPHAALPPHPSSEVLRLRKERDYQVAWRDRDAADPNPRLAGQTESFDHPQGLDGRIIHAELEIDGSRLREGAGECLTLLVIDRIAVEDPQLGKIEGLRSTQRLLQHIAAVSVSNRLAQALVNHNPRTERSDKAIVPVAHGVVAIADFQLGYAIEQVLAGVCSVDIGGTGIGAHAQQGKPAGSLELGIKCEL